MSHSPSRRHQALLLSNDQLHQAAQLGFLHFSQSPQLYRSEALGKDRELGLLLGLQLTVFGHQVYEAIFLAFVVVSG